MHEPPDPPYICPHCGGPSRWQTPRYFDALCPECRGRLVDRHGRTVDVYNETLMGTGVLALHRDDESRCELASRGEVYLDGTRYTAWEARFGGIVVRPRRD